MSLNPDAVAAVRAAWAARPANTYANAYTRLVEAAAGDPELVAALVRGLPKQWVELAQMIEATAEALNDVQAETDRAFHQLANLTAGDAVDLLDLLGGQVTGLNRDDLDDEPPNAG